jgi:hypothetical protein
MRRVTEIRERLRRGLTDDEYLTVIRVLQRMAANLKVDGTAA